VWVFASVPIVVASEMGLVLAPCQLRCFESGSFARQNRLVFYGTVNLQV
jgi:hypothetical protein